MTRIRCTQALQKILRIKPDETQDSLTSTPLGDWYAHLLWIERKKCILFTNEVTLFNFFALDVKKADLADMNTFFRENLRRGLEAVGIIGAPASRLLLALGNITISKTNNRSVLGSMNDYAFQYRVYVETQGGLHHCDTLDMISSINESPMRAIGYDSGTRRLKQYLEGNI
jgi:hypothetical protein